MTISQDQGLAADIENAVRAVPGVSALFRAGTLVDHTIDAGARLTGLRDGSAPLIRLDQATDALRADIAIGVHGRAGAVETTRRAHEAALTAAAAHGPDRVEIRITVVHIDEAQR